MTTLIDLPYYIIQRIIYLRFILDGSFIHIYPLFLTCRTLYDHHYMLYTLKPIIITDNKHPKAFPKQVLNNLDHEICIRIRQMTLLLPVTINLCKFNLKRITLQGSFESLKIIFELPKTITHLKLILENSKHQFRKKQYNFQSKEITFKLVEFKYRGLIWTSKPTSINWLVSFSNRITGSTHSSSQAITSLLCDLIYNQRKSLRYIDIEMFPLEKIINNFNFPNLRLVKIDQTSKLSPWFVRLLLSNRKTVLIIVNTLKSEIIKMELSHTGSPVRREKFHISDSIITRLKSQFEIS